MTQANTAGAPKPAAKAAPKAKADPKAKAAPKASDGAENKEKKPRAPRKDYGYSPASIIHINKEKEVKMSGKRADYYKLLVANDGKTVNDFEAAAPKDDSPRGWLRFFATNGFCTLERPKEAEKAKVKEAK